MIPTISIFTYISKYKLHHTGCLLYGKELQTTTTEHKEKTKIVDMREGKEGFDFLGFHHRQKLSYRYKKWYTQKWPRKEALNKLRQGIRDRVQSRSILHYTIDEVIETINPLLRGWMNYFKYGNSSSTFNKVDSYVQMRLALWWRKKHHKRFGSWKHFNYLQYITSGVVTMTGKVQYWSKLKA